MHLNKGYPKQGSSGSEIWFRDFRSLSRKGSGVLPDRVGLLGAFLSGSPRKRARSCPGACKKKFVCATLCYDAWSTMIHKEWGSKPSLLQYCRLDIARSNSPHPEHKVALHQEVIYSTTHCLKTSGNACVHTKDGQSQPSFHHTQSQCPMVNVTRCCASPRHLLGMQISQQLRHI
jgi:hypothetical protein